MANLTTLAQVKSWLKLTVETDDTLLETLIEAASSFIESWLSRTLSSTAYTETRSGQGGVAMLFANYPVTAVESVIVDGQAKAMTVDYLFDNLAVYLTRGDRFPNGVMNVQLAYTAGYATIPPAVAQACCELVGKKYRERDRIGQTSKTLAGEVVSFSPSDLTAEVKSMLRNYQKVVPV